jgi:hypothetical protein
MPRQKEIIATVNATTELFPYPKVFKADLAGNLVPVAAMRLVNGVLVPNLQTGWTERVVPRFPTKLPNDQLAELEKVLDEYVCARVACINAITWIELRSRFERIAKISGALLKELSDWSSTYPIAWRKISRVAERHGQDRLGHDDVYPIVSRLHGSCVHALEEAKRARDAGARGDHRAPWIALIRDLRRLFEQAGGRATAAKNLRGGLSARPSSFVELVWSVMTEAVPKELREHAHSKSAMANQISRALATIRGRPDGPIPGAPILK